MRAGQVDKFIQQLKILLSDISYHLFQKHKKNATQRDKDKEFAAWEGYFQTIIYLITAFVGYQVQTEITKHKGRLDLLVEAKDFLYLMEFKLDEPVENAIQQIKHRKYAASYQNSTKTVLLVGVNFSQTERNVDDWEWEEWER